MAPAASLHLVPGSFSCSSYLGLRTRRHLGAQQWGTQVGRSPATPSTNTHSNIRSCHSPLGGHLQNSTRADHPARTAHNPSSPATNIAPAQALPPQHLYQYPVHPTATTCLDRAATLTRSPTATSPTPPVALTAKHQPTANSQQQQQQAHAARSSKRRRSTSQGRSQGARLLVGFYIITQE